MFFLYLQGYPFIYIFHIYTCIYYMWGRSHNPALDVFFSIILTDGGVNLYFTATWMLCWIRDLLRGPGYTHCYCCPHCIRLCILLRYSLYHLGGTWMFCCFQDLSYGPTWHFLLLILSSLINYILLPTGWGRCLHRAWFLSKFLTKKGFSCLSICWICAVLFCWSILYVCVKHLEITLLQIGTSME